MTHHLTDEQLGALRDAALSAAETAAAERHVAGCAACRDRLAELAALDDALATALEHDPGEAYFASFADRVASRLASAAPAPAPRTGLAAWWSSPRRLAWAGGALAIVAVAALVVTLSREHGPAELADRVAPMAELGARAAAPAGGALAPPEAPSRREAREAEEARKDAAPAATRAIRPAPLPAPGAPGVAREPGAPANAPARLEEERRDRGAAPVPQAQEAKGRLASDQAARAQNVVEVRTLPNGEQQVVHRPGAAAPPAPAPAPAYAFAPAPAGAAFQKPRATPLASRSLAGGTAPAPADAESKSVAVQELGPRRLVGRDEGSTAVTAGSLHLCGSVRDARGRAAAGALVTLVESGASATAGADGAFCVDAPAAGGTLSVLAVGYRPYRARVSAASAAAPLAVALSPVDVLAPSMMALKRPGASERADRPVTSAVHPSVARQSALDAQAAALKAGTAAAWTAAAQRWDTVARMEPAASAAEPLFHAAESRVNAWLVGRADEKQAPALRAAALTAVQACLERTGEGPTRDIVLGWYRVLER